MPQAILSAFGDEISPELQEQMDVLEANGVSHIELRGVWGKNVVNLTDAEVMRVREQMDSRGFKVSAIGSPIGKVGIDDDWDKHIKDYRRIIEIAKALGTSYIRLFSFFIPEGKNPADYRGKVIERMSLFARLAGESGLIALHENESRIYGDIPERCADIINSVNSPNLGVIFDPANFVQCKVKPLEEAFPLLSDRIQYMHIKDARMDTGKVFPAGHGDGQVKEILRRLFERGFTGFLSLEPHLANAGRFSGFTGPELFKVAADALKGILADLEIEYR